MVNDWLNKEAQNKHYQKSHTAYQSFHYRPRTESLLFVHSQKTTHQPETRIINMRQYCSSTGDKPYGQGECPDRRLATTGDAKASRASLRNGNRFY